MMKRVGQVLCVGLLLAAAPALLAQSGTGYQTNTAPGRDPNAMPGPALPPGPNATGDACKGVVPDGGTPYWLRAETAEQRMKRLGTAEDPGCDPPQGKVYVRYGKEYTIDKYDRYWAVYGGGPDADAIRPFGFVNSYRELYQQNDKWVWVWQQVVTPEALHAAENPPEDLRKSTQSNYHFTDQEVEYLQRARSEFFELTPPKNAKTIRFEESSEGLPQGGSWRNGLAVADMNGDHCPDIVAPPERAGGTGIPAIFLGDCKGHWTFWQQVRWPHAVDYGSVVAADFNDDGKMDLAFAVHLAGVYVFLGDGKGNFVESTKGLPRDFPTRRLIATDVDRDGNPDIIAISEGPTAVQRNTPVSKIRVFYNRDKGMRWEGADVATPDTRVGGDYLSIGNFGGKKYPDIVAGSIYMGSPDIIYLSTGPNKWSKLDSKVGAVVPFLSFYLASATGKFSSKKTDDAILSYVRVWPSDVNEKLIPRPPLTEVTGLDRISFSGGTAKRTPIARWGGKFGITGVAAADLDGDGNTDIIYTTYSGPERREVVALLGDGKGNFSRATLDGITTQKNATYDLKAVDVNGDGRPDIVMMYEADQTTAFSPRNGSIRVFLNRGPEAPARVADH